MKCWCPLWLVCPLNQRGRLVLYMLISEADESLALVRMPGCWRGENSPDFITPGGEGTIAVVAVMLSEQERYSR